MIYLGRREVAQIMGVDQATVLRWSKKGRIKSVQIFSGIRRYPLDQIVEYLRTQGRPIHPVIWRAILDDFIASDGFQLAVIGGAKSVHLSPNGRWKVEDNEEDDGIDVPLVDLLIDEGQVTRVAAFYQQKVALKQRQQEALNAILLSKTN